jgi:putative transposase
LAHPQAVHLFVDLIVKFIVLQGAVNSLEVLKMFVKYEHNLVGAYLHLQITPAYRRKIFCDGVLIKFCRHEFIRISKDLGVELVACAFGPDHVHLFVGGWKNHSIADLARRFKGGSSRFLRKNFWNRVKTMLWGDKFWTSGYFAETVGRITTGKMKHYIDRQQEKHWKDQNYQIYLETHIQPEPQTNLNDYI